ncbi:DUF222 domain-containing protein [Microbacterium pumilum]|uniref:HNH endonuclease n=1 Tax=Microbacterium pumilum TaxID=344165 RepID=A0ABP5DAG6_9MICO
MSANLDSPPEAEDVEAEWARLMEVAESWGVDPEPRDSDIIWDDEPITPGVARYLAGVSHREQLLCEWEDAAAQIAKWQAVQARILADALDLALVDGSSRRDTDLAVRSMAAELACAVGMSDRTVQAHMNDAQVLRDLYAASLSKLRSGGMSRAHAQVIIDEGTRLMDGEVRADYERMMLELPAHLTTSRMRVIAKAIAEDLQPVSLTERHLEARAGRRVEVRDTDDGMAELLVPLPAVLAHGIYDRLTQQARIILAAELAAAKADAAKADGRAGAAMADAAIAATGADTTAVAGDIRPVRTLDQIRADMLCDLLLTGHATVEGIDADGGEGIDAIRGIVQITVPQSVLAGDDAGPSACLTGRGPIDSETAQRMAGNASLWHLVLTDRTSGAVVAVERRFPNEAQVRHLRARDEHCRFPGCRAPVWRCDIDHSIDHQHGGATSICNLAHLCRRHHTLKHNTAWQLRQLEGGVLEWTSPLGRVYIEHPPATLRFIPERE